MPEDKITQNATRKRSPHVTPLEGRRFGRLTALEHAEKRTPNWGMRWLCLCDCGQRKIVAARELIAGHTRSCGCLNEEQIAKRRLPVGESCCRWLIRKYKRDAGKRGLEWMLEAIDCGLLFAAECHYCGVQPLQKIKFNGSFGAFVYNGIDRVVNERGYTTDNVVPCCFVCNRAKNCMAYDDFIRWARRVASH